MSDFDGAWKEALDHHLPDVLALLFETAWREIDWAHDYEPLEQELRQLSAQGEAGARRCDKLVKVVLKGEGDVAYLHVEVQNEREEGFDYRVYGYNYRAEDRLSHPIVSLVILGDDSPGWRPREYVFERWGCRKAFRFPVVKLLDYRGREEELEAHANPAALLVLAHLTVLATRHRPAERLEGKMRVLESLSRREMDAEGRRRWYRVFDGLMDLPEELEREVGRRIRAFEEGQGMERLTNLERFGYERGEQKGLRQGLAVSLRLAFGPSATGLIQAMEKADIAALERIAAGIEARKSIEELEAMVAATVNGSAPPPAAS